MVKLRKGNSCSSGSWMSFIQGTGSRGGALAVIATEEAPIAGTGWNRSAQYSKGR